MYFQRYTLRNYSWLILVPNFRTVLSFSSINQHWKQTLDVGLLQENFYYISTCFSFFAHWDDFAFCYYFLSYVHYSFQSKHVCVSDFLTLPIRTCSHCFAFVSIPKSSNLAWIFRRWVKFFFNTSLYSQFSTIATFTVCSWVTRLTYFFAFFLISCTSVRDLSHMKARAEYLLSVFE